MTSSELLTSPEALRSAVNTEARIDFHLEDGVQSRTAAELLERASFNAARLVERGIRPGDMVGLVGSNRPEWAEWAYAIWLAGAALVPLPAPVRIRNKEAYAEQIRFLSSAMTCVALVSEPKLREVLGTEETIDWNESSNSQLEVPEPPSLDAIATVLCTSGSTSMPKGVMVDHRTIAARELRRAQIGTQIGRDVMWLPFFHTGGISTIIKPAYHGVVTHILPTERFARDPISWFHTITEVGGTVTGAASSAWFTAMRAAERKPDGIDLSTLKSAIFSLEMIDPEAVDYCTSVGKRFGLSPTALNCSYGMSEGTGISSTPPGEGIRIETLDLDELVSSRRAVIATTGLTKRVASCGRPSSGVELKIIDEEGNILGDREVGQVIVRSSSLMKGYLGQSDSGISPDGWLFTGDAGYLTDGELFLTGRVKELIISRGHNYHPEDIERAATVALGISQDRCVAFSKPDAEGEAVVVIEAVDGLEPSTALSAVRESVTSTVGQLVMDIVFVTPDSIPRTPTGKMKRNEARQMLMDGSFSLA